MLKILLFRKSGRTFNTSALKLNGPKGLVINISNKGDIYVKGKCIYAAIPLIYQNRLEVNNEDLIGKPITIVIKDSKHIQRLIDEINYDYFSPILKEEYYLIKKIPKYFILEIDKGIPRLPKTGFSISNPNPDSNQSELIIDLVDDSVLKGEHLFYLQPGTQLKRQFRV